MDPLNAAQIRKRTSASGTDEAKPVAAAKAAKVIKMTNTRKATNRVIENASEISEERQSLKQVPHWKLPMKRKAFGGPILGSCDSSTAVFFSLIRLRNLTVALGVDPASSVTDRS
jgi:hypothetical protein